MSRQDRQGVRTPVELERKYAFERIDGAMEAATNANKAVEELDERLNQDGIFNRLTDNGTWQGIFKGDDGNVYINASYLVTGILKSKDSDSFYLDLDNGILKGRFSEFSIAGKSVDTIAGEKADTALESAQTYADTAAKGAVDAQTQTDVFNKLTNNGTAKGIYYVGGQLYINASYLDAGILKSQDGESFYLDLDNGILKGNFADLSVAGKTASWYDNGDGSYTLVSGDYSGGGAGDVPAVLYTEQTLTDAQKAQARSNIGAAYFVNPVQDGVASYTVTADTIGKTIRFVSGSTDYVINIVEDSSIPRGAKFEILHQWSKSSKIVFSNNASVMLEGGTGALTDYTITLPKGFYTVSLQKYVSGSGGDAWFVRVGGNKPITLWSGSWTSGSITVPGLSNYKLFAISTFNASSGAAQGTNIIASLESDAFIRGMGGYPTASSGTQWTSVTHYYASINASGDTLTFGYAKTSAGAALGIDRIDGLI